MTGRGPFDAPGWSHLTIPPAGVCMQSGRGQFSFVDCNMHGNGCAGIYGAPFGLSDGGKKKTVPGSVQATGGNYSNNGPEWSGSKTTVVGAKCESNCANQVDMHSTRNKPVLIVGMHARMGPSNGPNAPGGMVFLSEGGCETLVVEGCGMDGSSAATPQLYGVAAGGFQAHRAGTGAPKKGQNQETVRVVNNVFRNMLH